MFRLKADSARAVDVFVRRVTASRVFWCLDDDGAIAGCAAKDGRRDVFPVFSDAAYARRGAACWEDIYPPISLELEFLVETVLPFQIQQGQLIGPNWDGSMAGAELEPAELLDRLKAAAKGV